jgi:predicted nucleic acid-binding protein
VNPDAALYARYGYEFLRHEAVQRRTPQATQEDSCQWCAHFGRHKNGTLIRVEISAHKQRDETALGAFLAYVETLDFPDQASTDYAKIRAHLKTQGTMIGANDLFIAAHARSLGLTLVTNNTREFARVPQLTIENWTLGS